MKRYGQPTLQQIFFWGMLLSLFIWVSPLSPITPQMPVGPQMPTGIPNLSPAEQKQLETEMATFQEEFNKLSPQEQESFYQSMETAVQKIEALSQTEDGKALLNKLDKGEISDAELDQLINRLTGEEPKEEKIAEKEPEVEPEVVKPAPKPSVTLSTKEEQAIEMISTLISETDSFMVKVGTIPELPGHIKRWTKKGKISWAPATQQWSDLKEGIEKFIVRLNALLEQDPKSSAYYHIAELVKNETLYNNLRKVATVVSAQEPLVKVTSPLHKISKESRTAIQKLINQYIEALYTLKLPEEFATLIKKFDPKALAAREAEEKAAKAAELAAKREQVAPGRPIVAGRGEEPRYYTPLYDYEERREPRVAPKTYIPEAPSRAYTPPQPVTPAVPKSALARPSVDKKKEEEKKKEEGPGILSKEYKERAAVLDKERQEKINRLANTAIDMIDSVGKDLAKATPLQLLEQHLIDATPVDITLVTETIPGIQQDLSLRRGIQGKIAELKDTIRTPRARKHYQERLKKQYDTHKKTFDTIEKQINMIEQKFDILKEEIPAEKLYAYFGIRTEPPVKAPEEKVAVPYEAVEKKLGEIAQEAKTEEEGLEKAVAYLESSLAKEKETKEPTAEIVTPLQEIERKVPTPISLFDLRNFLRDLKKAIDEFDKAPVKEAIKK